MANRILSDWSEVTDEDIQEVFQKMDERASKFAINEDCGVKTEVIDGHLVFDSWEDAEKYYGGLYTIDEVFGKY